MDKENMTKLVEMANCDIGISKRRYKFTWFYLYYVN
jgi:hypothetical protein